MTDVAGAPRQNKLKARCTCEFYLWQVRQGEWTLKATILKIGPDGRTFVAKCPSCGAWVAIPFMQLAEPSAETTAPARL